MRASNGFHRCGRLVAILVVSACASVRPAPTTAVTVQPGDARARVLEQLGEPSDRQFSGDDEALQFCKTTGNVLLDSQAGEYTVVWLFKGRVTGVTTYREVLGSFKKCESAFRSIRWEEAPTRPPATMLDADRE